MDKLLLIEWAELLIPTHSLAEIMLRGTVMYLSLFLILRFVMLRQSSTIGIADILVVVLIADAAQNGFAREYQSLTEGVLLVLTIVFWNIFLNWLSYRFKVFERLLAPPPLRLVDHGKMNRNNMRKQFITEEELRAQLREQGVQDMAEVKQACLEANGEISVVKVDSEGDDGGKKRKKRI
ncbi:MAG: YetF domain-containing protein [Pseudomonadota bacterium]